MDSISPTMLIRYLETRFPGCYGAVDSLRSGKNWPGIPQIADLLAERYRSSVAAASYCAPALCACAVWNCYKRVYAFQEPLAATLCGGAEESLDFPVDPLRYLPLPGIYVQAPGCICPGIHGFFAWLHEPSGAVPAMHLLFLHDDGLGFTPGSILLEPGRMLRDSLPDPDEILYPILMAAAEGDEAALQVMLQKLPLSGPAFNVIHNLTVRAAQLLLYLVSTNADIDPEPDTGEGVIRVGGTVSRKLQTTAPRKAHIRQGHWHKYWYGPKNGERRLIPKWIPPVIVGEDRELSVKLSVQNID